MKNKITQFFPWKWNNSPQRRIFKYLHGLVFQRDFHLWMDDSSDVTSDPTALGEKEPVLREAAGWNGICLPGNHVTSPARSRFLFFLKLQTQGFRSVS